jgi:sugar lactone lactonase YvrE
MAQQLSRYSAPNPPTIAEGWTLKRVSGPSRLFGANGIRTGPDGRIYVAQVAGSQISAIDINTGEIEAISPMGGDIVGPDDLVFDDEGNLYATEITENRVTMLRPDGTSKVIWGDIPVANPITFHQGHLIAGELRMGARILELDRNGGEPRVIAQDLPMTNAFEVGPDGKLYFPAQAANEIWRVSLEGGEPEKVAGDLGIPDSVKFHPDGYIVSTQVGTGEVLRIDPRTGEKSVLAQLAPGLDNVTFVGKRIFVSSIPGKIYEILEPGKVRDLVSAGYNGPLGLTVDPSGSLFVADGPFLYSVQQDGERQVAGMLFYPGYPGYIRGIRSSGPGEVLVTTSQGAVARYRPGQAETEVLADGFYRLYGVALGSNGSIAFAEAGKGRVLSLSNGNVEELASGLKEPFGVAIGPDGAVLAAESQGGRVVKVSGGRAETVVDGLGQPNGLHVRGQKLYIVDSLAKELIEYDLSIGARQTIASDLPIGPPAGVVPKFLGGIGDMAGPMGPFTDIDGGPDGTLYISGDAEGSVLAVGPA